LNFGTDCYPHKVPLHPRRRSARHPARCLLPVGCILNDREARVVVGLVARLDVTPLATVIKSREGRPGHPAIGPAILVAF
jgi:hypothetical protein